MTNNRGRKILAWALFLTAVATVAYWADFYFGKAVQVRDNDWYVTFQKAFPVADAWMAGFATLAAIGLLRGHRYGSACGLVAGSALVFLALMDITFNVQNDLYPLAATTSAMRMEIIINAWTLGLGLITIAILWPRGA